MSPEVETPMDIVDVLESLAEKGKDGGVSAYLSPEGVFLIEEGNVRRLSSQPPLSMTVEDVLPMGTVVEELTRNHGACDVAYTWNQWRVVNAFRLAGGRVTNEVRLFHPQPPPASELGLEGLLERAGILERGGLALVAGDRGAVRATAMCAMAVEAAEGRFVEMIEDPVIHTPRVRDGIVCLREVGLAGGDVPTFAEGLRQAAGRRPHLVVVGDLPDTTTVRLAVDAAAGGIAVLAGCHGLSARDAVRRLVSLGRAGDPSVSFRRSLGHVLRLVVFLSSGRKPETVVGDDLREMIG